jgi:hypothetical protein
VRQPICDVKNIRAHVLRCDVPGIHTPNSVLYHDSARKTYTGKHHLCLGWARHKPWAKVRELGSSLSKTFSLTDRVEPEAFVFSDFLSGFKVKHL